MHTAKQLNASLFDIKINGKRAPLGALFPNWHRFDRFGIVVARPFGSLGASLLIQAAITAFYDLRRSQANSAAVYPEIYLLHAGGHWGDHSTLDFWPPRKEVFIAEDPREVLGAINNLGITRLAVPAGASGMPHIDWQDNGKERTAAKERVSSIFSYDADGSVSGADVSISATSDVTEENIAAILDPQSVLTASLREESPDAPGDPVLKEYLEAVARRMTEVSALLRASISDRRRRMTETGGRKETYRRIDFAEALCFFTTATPSSSHAPGYPRNDSLSTT